MEAILQVNFINQQRDSRSTRVQPRKGEASHQLLHEAAVCCKEQSLAVLSKHMLRDAQEHLSKSRHKGSSGK